MNIVNELRALSIALEKGELPDDWHGVLEHACGLLERLGGPQEPKQPDNRAKQWRCRFRIYDTRDMDEPVADTDEELPADRPGTAVIAGLPAVAFEVAALTKAFHAPAVVLLTEEDLAKGLRGIRPTIHRNGGHGRWSLPYKTDDAGAVRSWLMRVDIVKEEAK